MAGSMDKSPFHLDKCAGPGKNKGIHKSAGLHKNTGVGLGEDGGTYLDLLSSVSRNDKADKPACFAKNREK